MRLRCLPGIASTLACRAGPAAHARHQRGSSARREYEARVVRQQPEPQSGQIEFMRVARRAGGLMAGGVRVGLLQVVYEAKRGSLGVIGHVLRKCILDILIVVLDQYDWLESHDWWWVLPDTLAARASLRSRSPSPMSWLPTMRPQAAGCATATGPDRGGSARALTIPVPKPSWLTCSSTNDFMVSGREIFIVLMSAGQIAWQNLQANPQRSAIRREGCKHS